MQWTLHASSLWAKHGFQDGDVITHPDNESDEDRAWELIEASGLEDEDILVLLVRRHLLPAIQSIDPTFKVDDITDFGSFTHNPIRHLDHGSSECPVHLEDFSVVVSEVEFQQSVLDIQEGREPKWYTLERGG